VVVVVLGGRGESLVEGEEQFVGPGSGPVAGQQFGGQVGVGEGEFPVGTSDSRISDGRTSDGRIWDGRTRD